MNASLPRHYDVLILGGGFAGVYCAQRALKRLRGTGKKVGLIASENHMVFQPMLPEVVGGSCSACFMKLRPQMQVELKTADRIMTCENCTRILYIVTESQTAAQEI